MTVAECKQVPCRGIAMEFSVDEMRTSHKNAERTARLAAKATQPKSGLVMEFTTDALGTGGGKGVRPHVGLRKPASNVRERIASFSQGGMLVPAAPPNPRTANASAQAKEVQAPSRKISTQNSTKQAAQNKEARLPSGSAKQGRGPTSHRASSM